MRIYRLGLVALLLTGCDVAKAAYDAVAATGDHSRDKIASAQPSATFASTTQMPAPPSFAPAPSPSAPLTASPTPDPLSTEIPPVVLPGASFNLSADARLWRVTEATVAGAASGIVGHVGSTDMSAWVTIESRPTDGDIFTESGRVALAYDSPAATQGPRIDGEFTHYLLGFSQEEAREVIVFFHANETYIVTLSYSSATPQSAARDISGRFVEMLAGWRWTDGMPPRLDPTPRPPVDCGAIVECSIPVQGQGDNFVVGVSGARARIQADCEPYRQDERLDRRRLKIYCGKFKP